VVYPFGFIILLLLHPYIIKQNIIMNAFIDLQFLIIKPPIYFVLSPDLTD